jgi:hypothetical protein
VDGSRDGTLPPSSSWRFETPPAWTATVSLRRRRPWGEGPAAARGSSRGVGCSSGNDFGSAVRRGGPRSAPSPACAESHPPSSRHQSQQHGMSIPSACSANPNVAMTTENASHCFCACLSPHSSLDTNHVFACLDRVQNCRSRRERERTSTSSRRRSAALAPELPRRSRTTVASGTEKCPCRRDTGVRSESEPSTPAAQPSEQPTTRS